MALIIMTACHDSENLNSVTDAEFSFTILGNVDNADGVELALYIPSQGLDNRIKSTVKEGKYLFKGKLKKIEMAEILFEENIINESSMYATFPIFIEPDTIQLDFSIMGDSLLRRIGNPNLIKGENNNFFYQVATEYGNHFSFIVAPNKAINDSLHQFVYPKVRENLLAVYDSIFTNSKYSAVALAVLNMTVNNNDPFQFDRLNESEKKKLIQFFNNIDTTLAGTPDYRKLKKKIDKLETLKSDISFVDFELSDINDSKVRLSDVIKSNEYTILYFWWTGCSPCRKFNREMTRDKYASLRENGVEFISISVDNSNQRWKKASKEDSISWINLYARAVSDIESDYNVKGFPTKIIFDKNLNIIHFNFKEPSELLKLAEE